MTQCPGGASRLVAYTFPFFSPFGLRRASAGATLALASVGLAAEPAIALEEKTLPDVSQATATDKSIDAAGTAAPPPSGFTIGATGLSPYYSASGVSFDQLMQSDTERALSYFTPRWGGLM